MEYKEGTFEIDNEHIKFKRNMVISLSIGVIFLSFFIINGIILFKDKGAFISYSTAFSVSIILYVLCAKRFLKTKIHLNDISHVEVKHYNTIKGTGNWKTYFPSGINRKKTSHLFFIHQKNKKMIIGFSPENCDSTILTLQQNGIRLSDLTVKQ